MGVTTRSGACFLEKSIPGSQYRNGRLESQQPDSNRDSILEFLLANEK